MTQDELLTKDRALYRAPTRHFRNDGFFNPEVCKFGGDDLLAPWIFLRDYFAARNIVVRLVA